MIAVLGIAWVLGCVLVVLFVCGASAMRDDEDTWGALDAEPSEPCKVLAFPRRPIPLDDPPEYHPIIDGLDRGWVS